MFTLCCKLNSVNPQDLLGRYYKRSDARRQTYYRVNHSYPTALKYTSADFPTYLWQPTVLASLVNAYSLHHICQKMWDLPLRFLSARVSPTLVWKYATRFICKRTNVGLAELYLLFTLLQAFHMISQKLDQVGSWIDACFLNLLNSINKAKGIEWDQAPGSAQDRFTIGQC